MQLKDHHSTSLHGDVLTFAHSFVALLAARSRPPPSRPAPLRPVPRGPARHPEGGRRAPGCRARRAARQALEVTRRARNRARGIERGKCCSRQLELLMLIHSDSQIGGKTSSWA